MGFSRCKTAALTEQGAPRPLYPEPGISCLDPAFRQINRRKQTVSRREGKIASFFHDIFLHGQAAPAARRMRSIRENVKNAGGESSLSPTAFSHFRSARGNIYPFPQASHAHKMIIRSISNIVYAGPGVATPGAGYRGRGGPCLAFTAAPADRCQRRDHPGRTH